MPNQEFICNICGAKFIRYWNNYLEKQQPGGARRCDEHKSPSIKIPWKHKNVHHNVFNDPITPEAAYWIGYLLADGCVSLRKDGMPLLSAGSIDHEHILKLADFLGADSSSVVSKRNGFSLKGEAKMISVIHLVAPKLGARLMELGFTNRKSYDATVPKELEFNSDFWRGQVDGDGTIGRNGGSPRVQTCGTIDVVQKFSNFVKHYTGFCGTIKPRENIFITSVSGLNAFSMVELMWGHEGPALLRKQTIAQDILSHPPTIFTSLFSGAKTTRWINQSE